MKILIKTFNFFTSSKNSLSPFNKKFNKTEIQWNIKLSQNSEHGLSVKD